MTCYLLKASVWLVEKSKTGDNFSQFPPIFVYLFILAMRQHTLKANKTKQRIKYILPRESGIGLWLCLPPKRALLGADL